jgi:hypothetical protein
VVSRCVQGMINMSINQMNLLLHFSTYVTTVQNVYCGFLYTASLIPNKSFLLVESVQAFQYVSSSIHNLMQQFLSCVCLVLWDISFI